MPKAPSVCVRCLDSGSIERDGSIYGIEFCQCPEGRDLRERVQRWTSLEWAACDPELARAYMVALTEEAARSQGA